MANGLGRVLRTGLAWLRHSTASRFRRSGAHPSRTCKHCRYYNGEQVGGWDDEPTTWQGDCIRMPPVITGEYRTAPDNRRTQRLGRFPMVEARWTCGEFRPR